MKPNEVYFCCLVVILIIRYLECKPSGSDIENTLVKDILEKAFTLQKKNNHAANEDIAKKDTVAVNEYETLEKRSHFGASHDENHVILGRCDISKNCDSGQYCDGMFCYKCKGEGHHCDLNGECCSGAECQFGICTKGVSPGDPGTFCDIAKDCKGKDVCCIREISISHHHSICKLMLEEHESCGPINLFHQDVLRAHMDPMCGPCKSTLACKGVGIHGRHSICLPEDEE